LKTRGFWEGGSGYDRAPSGAGENDLPGDRERTDRLIEGRCANHFELAFTESEFLADFGQAYDMTEKPLVHTRIILTPRSAKTLARMMQEIVDQFEATVRLIEDSKS
jgi:hypothetical protein